MSDSYMSVDLRQINNRPSGQATQKAEKSSDALVSGKMASGKMASENKSENRSDSANSIAQQDSVKFSDKAQLVQSLLSDLSSRPEVNQSRVDQLKTSIASGEFSVSADKIASKMLDLDIGLRKLG